MSAFAVSTVGREYLRGGQVKGLVPRAHLEWLSEVAGPEAVHEVWERVPSEIAGEWASLVLSSSWYPFYWLVAVDRAIAATARARISDPLFELGRAAARRATTTVLRSLPRSGVHEFLRHSTLFHSQLFDFGNLRYERLGTTSGRMILHHANFFSPVGCASATGYWTEMIVRAGGSNVSALESSCQCLDQSTCTWLLEWTDGSGAPDAHPASS